MVPASTEKLHLYLQSHLDVMLNEWYTTLENNNSSFYTTKTSEDLKKELKTSFTILLENVIKVFQEGEEFKVSISDWAVTVAEKRANDQVPILESIQQLNSVREILVSYMENFLEESQTESFPVSEIFHWNRMVHYAFDHFVHIFIEHYDKYKHTQLSAQLETIYELSSPVIPITKGVAVLPIIGDIDTRRAQIILETALHECNDNRFTDLFIDLSGVPLIDTMVAHQIFQVIHALKLIGVKGYLSGLRPEVAQTAIQLGVDFSHIPIFNNLASALSKIGIHEVNS